MNLYVKSISKSIKGEKVLDISVVHLNLVKYMEYMVKMVQVKQCYSEPLQVL